MLKYQRISHAGAINDRGFHLLRQLIKRFRERKRNLHMVFIDLEKAYDKVSREIMVDIDEKGCPHQIY